MTFHSRLATISLAKARAVLNAKARELQSAYGFFPNEVDPAHRFVMHLLDGERTGLVAWPMQSGKTSIIACIYFMLKAIIPELRGVFICANDHTDLRRQNLERLEHLPDFDVLSRVERRTWESYEQELLIVFYDESHYGDGVNMTINEFLERHEIKKSQRIVFCGVSATPFTSIDCLDFEIWPDMKALEQAGYNSPGEMLRRVRIVQAEQLFVRRNPVAPVEINRASNVYRHVERVMAKPIPQGYCMIRATFEEAQALEVHLRERFGSRAFVKHWNMRAKDFSPESFFRMKRPGVFTVVLVQHKARMGNTIDTEHFEFFYEYSPSACLDTILQSFVGRACGFNKKNHRAVVYSNKRMAEAYDILINSAGSERELQRFSNFCVIHGLKPAVRATLGTRQAEFEVDIIAEKDYHGRTSLERIKDDIREFARRNNLGRGSIRTLSKTKVPERKKGRNVLHPDAGDHSFFCGTTPGDWGAFIYDKYEPGAVGMKKDWTGTIVKIAYRTDRRTQGRGVVGPTERSLHATF